MTTNKMSIISRKEYLSQIKDRYLKAGQKDKSAMLREFAKNTGRNIKYAIRILATGHEYKAKCINRKVHYIYTNEDIF